MTVTTLHLFSCCLKPCVDLWPAQAASFVQGVVPVAVHRLHLHEVVVVGQQAVLLLLDRLLQAGRVKGQKLRMWCCTSAEATNQINWLIRLIDYYKNRHLIDLRVATFLFCCVFLHSKGILIILILIYNYCRNIAWSSDAWFLPLQSCWIKNIRTEANLGLAIWFWEQKLWDIVLA